MHGLDLGPTSHVIGNVFADMVEHPGLGRNQKTRLEWVWAKVQGTYRRLAVDSKLDNLTLNMFLHDGDFPRLNCKANETRHVLPRLLDILKDPVVADDSECGRCRFSCVQLLCRFYALCDEPKYFLSRAASADAKKCIEDFVSCYTWLTDWAIASGKMRWQLTIKLHYFSTRRT